MRHLVLVLSFLTLCGICYGNLMSIPDTYGLQASDVGTAKAGSLFTSGYSAGYFNPAGLAQDNETHIGLSYVYGKPQLRINDHVALTEPNEVIISGLKINMSSAMHFVLLMVQGTYLQKQAFF